MKKIIIAIICFIFLPYTSSAFFFVPTFTLTIVKDTTTEDGAFNFSLYRRNSFGFDLISDAQTQVSTSNQHGSSQLALTTEDYQLYESQQTGWRTDSVSCTSDNPNTNFTSLNNGIQIESIATGEQIICTFTNSKESTKPPILIVPGLFGTDIYKGNALLWADIERMVNPLNGDIFMDPLQFKPDISPLDSSLTLGGVIHKKTKHIGQQEITLYDYTDSLINLLVSQGYNEGKDLFTFPYDWRYGASEDIVNQLKGQIDYILNQTDAGKAAGKVEVVAHSTGGLIVKKYIIEHPSDHHIDKTVFVGVPNLGAPKAFKVLINGDNFDIPGLNDQEMKKIAQNVPIAYDLAPSREYVNQIGSFLTVNNLYAKSPGGSVDTDYDTAMGIFGIKHLINTTALANSQNLHTTAFDNYDIRNNGVDVYNIIGCKSGTFGKFTENLAISGAADNLFDFPKDTTGDGTVPLLSAQTIPADPSHVFFSPNQEHGKLPSADGIRQQIVNLLTGSSLDTNGKILSHDEVQQHPEKCQIKGESINIKSPVAIGVTDQDGNFSGIADDGSIQNDIPGADYEVWGEHKYVFLPNDDGQTYTIKLKGTGNGTFTVDDQSIDGDNVTQTQVFSNLPVTTAFTGQVNLGSTDTLTLDNNGDGAIDQTTQPTSIINSDQSQDITPPVSTSTIIGLMGQIGQYRSNVNITLSAIDPVIPGQESQTSGVLKTQYNLDNQGYQTYSTSVPVTAEGSHILSFFSTDKAGNNEPEAPIQFTIDKTPPELSIQFDPNIKDLSFTATDTLPTVVSATSTPFKTKTFSVPNVQVIDQDNIITATDAAGNQTILTFKDKNRKSQLKVDVKSLSYNGQLADINKLLLHFDWLYDKKGILQVLTQQVQSKKDFNILSVYGLGKTLITGKDQNGKVNQVFTGLKLLKVLTNKGDFIWSY